MTLTRKQGVAIATIVLAGLIAALALLLSGRGDEHTDHGPREANAKSAQPAASGAQASHADNEPAGLIALTPEQIRNARLEMAVAAPGKIRSTVEFPGEIKFNEDRTAHVVPAWPAWPNRWRPIWASASGKAICWRCLPAPSYRTNAAN